MLTYAQLAEHRNEMQRDRTAAGMIDNLVSGTLSSLWRVPDATRTCNYVLRIIMKNILGHDMYGYWMFLKVPEAMDTRRNFATHLLRTRVGQCMANGCPMRVMHDARMEHPSV